MKSDDTAHIQHFVDIEEVDQGVIKGMPSVDKSKLQPLPASQKIRQGDFRRHFVGEELDHTFPLHVLWCSSITHRLASAPDRASTRCMQQPAHWGLKSVT